MPNGSIEENFKSISIIDAIAIIILVCCLLKKFILLRRCICKIINLKSMHCVNSFLQEIERELMLNK